MSIKELWEELKRLSGEQITAFYKHFSELSKEFKNFREYIYKMKEHEGTYYVLTNKDGALNGYFFNTMYDERLQSFYSTSDIRAGERLYLVNDYYEQKTFIVQYRIYSPTKNTMFLEVKEYKHEEGYADPDYCYTDEFEKYVKELAEDKAMFDAAKKEYNKHQFAEDSEYPVDQRLDDFLCSQITQRIDREHRTYLEYTCLMYKVQEIVYRMHGRQFKKPARYEYSDF
jgi:hypothetical protein